MNNKPTCHPDTHESEQQTPLSLPNPPDRLNPEREHLITTIVNEKGCAPYLERVTAREGALLLVSERGRLKLATPADYEQLGEYMPPREILQDQFRKGLIEYQSRLYPAGFAKLEEKENGRYQTTITRFCEICREIVLIMERTKNCNTGNTTALKYHFCNLRDKAQEAVDVVNKMDMLSLARAEAREQLSCNTSCKHYGKENAAACKKCCRSNNLKDNFTEK